MTNAAILEAKLLRLQGVEDIKTLRHKYAYEANIVDGKSGNLKSLAALSAKNGTFDVGVGIAAGPVEIGFYRVAPGRGVGAVQVRLRSARRDVLEEFDVRVTETRHELPAAAVG